MRDAYTSLNMSKVKKMFLGTYVPLFEKVLPQSSKVALPGKPHNQNCTIQPFIQNVVVSLWPTWLNV